MRQSSHAMNVLGNLIKQSPKLAAELGLRIDLQFLGAGSFGVVFALDERKAVKITTNLDEISNAKCIMLHRLPNVVRIYRIVTVNECCHIIIMERLKPLPPWAVRALNRSEKPFNLPKKVRNNVQSLRRYRQQNDSLSNRDRRFFKQIDSAYVRLLRHGIDHSDMHDGNIMVSSDGTTFKLIDAM